LRSRALLRRRVGAAQRAVRGAGVRWSARGPRAVIGALVAAALVGPWLLGEGAQRFVSELLLMLAMAQMWNLLAGYGGLVSMGQQVFVGLGAYCLFFTSVSLNVAPYWVLALSPLVSALVAAVIALFLFRLREAYFAIGTWVFAEIV